MKNSKCILWLFLLLLLFGGCNLDGLDFKKLSGDVNFNPEITAPLGNATISIWDLVQISNGEFDKIVPLNGMNAIFPPLSFVRQADVSSSGDLKNLASIDIDKVTLEIILENRLKVSMNINGSIFDTGHNKEITNFTLANVAPNETKITLVSLAGVQLSNNVEFRILKFESSGSVTPVLIDLNDYFRITLNLNDLSISSENLTIKKSQRLKNPLGVFGFDFPDLDLKAFGAVPERDSLSIKTISHQKITFNQI